MTVLSLYPHNSVESMTHEELQALLDKAQESQKKGEYADAEYYATELIQAVPAGDTSCVHSSALLVLSDSLRMRGMLKQSLEKAELALTLSIQAKDVYQEAKAMSTLGVVYTLLGDYQQALNYCRKALAIDEELGSSAGMARDFGNLGIIYQNLGDYSLAVEYHNQALAINREIGAKDGIAGNSSNLGTVYRRMGNYDSSMAYFLEALSICEELEDTSFICMLNGNIGNLYYSLGSYDKALEYLSEAVAGSNQRGEKARAARFTANIGSVYISLGQHNQSLEFYLKALAMQEEEENKTDVATLEGNIGIAYAELGSYHKALEYFMKALVTHQELGQKSSIALLLGNIGNVYTLLGNYDVALDYYTRALVANEELGEKSAIANVSGSIGSLYANDQFAGYNAAKAEEFLLKAVALSKDIGAKQHLYKYEKAIAELYKNTNRKADAYDYLERYHIIEKEVQSEEATRQTQLIEYRRKVEEAERDRQVKLARFQEQEQLLYNTLPAQIADRILQGERTIADVYQNVSVFFSDIVGFTTISQRISAESLVQMLNRLFSQFDQLSRKYGMEKIKTIGDAYMAVCGAPNEYNNHAERTAFFALEVSELMDNFIVDSVGPISVRIGLHTGSVVAGIIGEVKYSYDMWGDAVNTAARMESHGEPGKIHVSEEFMRAFTIGTDHDLSRQHHHIRFVPRGEMDIKGKGIMRTYYLENGSNS